MRVPSVLGVRRLDAPGGVKLPPNPVGVGAGVEGVILLGFPAIMVGGVEGEDGEAGEGEQGAFSSLVAFSVRTSATLRDIWDKDLDGDGLRTVLT